MQKNKRFSKGTRGFDYYAMDKFMNSISPLKAYNSTVYGKLKSELNLNDNNLTIDEYNKIFNAEEVDNRRVKKERQNASFELILSPPKSVSIAALIYGQTEIIEAHKEAEAEVVKWIEEHYSEYYKDEEYVQTQDYIAVSFLHATTRPVEGEEQPHLHSHFKFMNMIKTKDGSFKAPIVTAMFKEQGTIKAVYDNALAFALMRRGYKLRQSKSNFELDAMPKEYINMFSGRSNQIKEMVNLGMSNKAAFFSTREEKNNDDKDQLLEKWKNMVDMTLNFKGLNNINSITVKEIIDDSIEQCLKHEMHFSRGDIIKKAKPFLIGKSFNEFYETLNDTLNEEKYLKHYKHDYFTTKEMRRVENRNLNSLKYNCDVHLDSRTVNLLINKYENKTSREYNSDFSLTKEQRNAISLVLSKKNKVVGIQGDAGSGKTFMLKALKEIAGSANIKLVGLSFQNAAVREMQDAGLDDSRTLDSMIYSKHNYEGNAIFIIDEVSMLDAVKFDKLLSRIPNNSKIVMLGDGKQLVPIAGGVPFSESKKLGMPVAKLETNYRQKDSDKFADRDSFILKNGTASLKKYIETKKNYENVVSHFNKIIIEKEEEDRNEDVLNYYLSKYKDKKDGTKIITHTNKRRLELNKMIHETIHKNEKQYSFTVKRKIQIDSDLIKRSSLGYEVGMYFSYKSYEGKIIKVSDEGLLLEGDRFAKFEEIKDRLDLVNIYREDKIDLCVGEQIIFTETSSNRAIKNSEMGTIDSINNDEITVTMYVDKGVAKQKIFNIKNFNSLDYGYAITTFKSQGKTFENIILDMNVESVNSQQFYVAATRAKYNMRIFTNNRDEFMNKALNTEERKKSIINNTGKITFFSIIREFFRGI